MLASSRDSRTYKKMHAFYYDNEPDWPSFHMFFLDHINTTKSGAKRRNSNVKAFAMPSAGSLEGSSERPTQPRPNLAEEKGHNNSTPLPSFVVT
jgi:hypothetical protein